MVAGTHAQLYLISKQQAFCSDVALLQQLSPAGCETELYKAENPLLFWSWSSSSRSGKNKLDWSL